MKNQKSHFNHWDNLGKGKESIDANNKHNTRAKEGGRPPKYYDAGGAAYKVLSGMKPRPRKQCVQKI